MRKTNLFSIVLMIVFSLTNLYSQEDAVKGEKKEEIPMYGLRVVHKTGTFFTTKIIEVTNIHRILPDQSTKDYSREITYYLTLKVPSSAEGGFQTLVVTVDSLAYKFKEGETVFEFNTMDMQGNALRFKDLNSKTVPIGREFEMIYSPYGEVAKIQGADIDETLDYVREKGEGYLSDVEMYIWVNGLSKEHLAYLADMKKIILPQEKVAKDSLWYSPISLELNGYSFNDTLAFRIVNYNAGAYTLEGESLNILPLNKDSFTYNISGLVKVTGVTGEGKAKMQLKATGRVESLETDYNVNAKIQVGEQYVIEQIKSNIKWELINVFQL
ncbi:MAG: hypothetical protein V1779_03040 [bacterium]